MNIFVWLMQNHLMDLRKDPTMAIEKELKKLNDDLLKSCRLTQETISKTSGVLMFFDAQKIQEIIDNNKKIGAFCSSFQEYFSGVINQHQPEDVNSKFISSGIAVNNELKQIADFTAGIAASLLSLNTGISDKYKINISQFTKIFQNIVWDSVISFLKNDMLLAKKTFFRSLELKKICSRMQESLIEAGKTAESAESSELTVLFIVQCIKDIAVHTVNITQTATSGLDEVIS
jgi:phosphate uptake regulator